MSIFLGNLSVDELEKRLGIEFTESEKKELRETHNPNASHIEEGKWHCFDIPFCFMTKGKKGMDLIDRILRPYSDKIKTQLMCKVED